MIISHRYKFIFVKTRKTAGTSIEIALSKFCGGDDVITPQTSENPKKPVNAALIKDEQLRAEKGYTPPQNYFVPRSDYGLREWRRFLLKGIKARYKKHSPASFISQRWPFEWATYFKFCVERNPWDKAVSTYHWFKGGRRYANGPMHEVLAGDLMRLSNWYIYSINDKPAVDYVIPYENLNPELDKIAERLGLPEKLDLPQAKGEFRKDRRAYEESITPESKQLIDRVCAKEIAYFGYKFGE